MTTEKTQEKLPVVPELAQPMNFDLALLAAFNPNNTLESSDSATSGQALEDKLYAINRDGAQLLINQILTAIPIVSTTDGPMAILPETSVSNLPREKELPKEKAMTKWQKFAAKKGIAAKARDNRRNLVYDEEKGEWVPKWGYKGSNKALDKQWLVEVDPKKQRADGEDENPRKLNRTERLERIKKNSRQEKKNAMKAAQGGKPGRK
ncbi:ribosomal biogenesis regulatory protein [Ascobolus immersus RN42]|uniref:Ribosome biogenesis regulatory protein n=1 Tax=Ascobolus immersus RN42 TaxID=1160509 RepID=A0A3N4ILG2_ASCIM|nr:ribosomal biogenesis regulatory protein [Ascobolus immersus RN42]